MATATRPFALRKIARYWDIVPTHRPTALRLLKLALSIFESFTDDSTAWERKQRARESWRSMAWPALLGFKSGATTARLPRISVLIGEMRPLRKKRLVESRGFEPLTPTIPFCGTGVPTSHENGPRLFIRLTVGLFAASSLMREHTEISVVASH